MGLVTDYLRNTIIKQVADHGVVVWYDPERHYTDAAETLNISNTAVARYDGSFFALRQQVEPLLESSDPPRLVVYVPLDQAETHNALVELETAGVVLKPGQQPPSHNTRLAVIARNALKAIHSDEKVAELEKQVEAGQLTLAELDAIAEKGGDVAGVISVIFNTSNPLDVALAFLSSTGYDTELVEKRAVAELVRLFENAFEIDLTVADTPAALRNHLARHVLTTDFVAALPGSLPSQLSGVKTATGEAARQACLHLAHTWRQRVDLRDSYQAQARQVETALKPATLDLSIDQLAASHTFLDIESTLQQQVAAALLTGPAPALIELARMRQSTFWSETRPEVQAEWALITVAGQVLLEAARIEQELKRSALDAETIFGNYTGVKTSGRKNASLITPHASLDAPWCLLDTYHRHMERRCHHFDFALGRRHATLEKLIAGARNRYMDVGARLSEAFLKQFRQNQFRLPRTLHQTEIFEKQVKPHLGRGKIAYIWVDALRFEMARDLAQTLVDEYDITTQAAVGIVPTITPIGMAALLPQAHRSPQLTVAGGRLALKLGDAVLKDRQSRVDYLTAQAGVTVFAAKLEELVPKPKKKVQQGIAGADLVLVTSQEIDQLCEGDNIHLARRTMDEILHELRRTLRILTELKVQTIVLTADHGYLFGEEQGEDMKIPAPGGNKVELHRRVWIGNGGDSHPAYLRTDLSNFGLNDEYELVTPWNFAIFKVQGGARAYFHGGLSPQELIVPVLTITPKQQAATPGPVGDIIWQLELGGSSRKITRFCSVQVTGQATGLFELDPPTVRVEVRTSAGEVISTPANAFYGYEEATGNTQLAVKDDDPRAIAPNFIAVHITDTTPQKNVSLHLVDATSGVELARVEGLEVTGGID